MAISSSESEKLIHKPPERRNTSFKGDVLRLVTGTGLAQIITILAAPILTRLYAPEAFGMVALFASLTSILGVVACMRYELSIVLPDNDREAANLLGVSLCFSVLIALLTVPVVWLGGSQMLQWVKMPELASYLWLIPVMVLIYGIFIALNYWNTRTKHFTRLSIARVTSALANTSGSLGAGFLGHATGGAMIAASVGGQVVAATVLGGQIWRDNGRFLVQSITWREMWVGLKRHRKFPIYSSGSMLLNVASWQLPVLMFGIFFSPAIVGFYALGFRILQIPISLIGGAISQVFFQRISVAKTTGNHASLVENLFQRLFIFGLFPCLILTIVGKELFVLIFGQNWAEAGIYTQLLGLWAFIWFISSPLSTTYIALERQEKELTINSVIFISRLLGIGIGGYFDSPRLAILFLAVGGIFAYGYLIKVIFDICQVSIAKILKQNLKFLVESIAFIVPLVLIKISDLHVSVVMLTVILTVFAYVFSHRKLFVLPFFVKTKLSQ